MDQARSTQKRVRLVYADGSRDLALQLGRALEAAGFVLIDQGAQSDGEDAVVICWTPAAVASDHVNMEAARARKAKTFTPITLAPCTPPAALGRPLADLSGWHGDATSREFLSLVSTLHSRLSRRMFSGDLWRSRYLSWGGLGAAGLGAVAIIANFGDLRQTIDGALNPAASERALNETNAKVEEVLLLLKQKSGQDLSDEAEAALRESIQRLLAAQDGARGAAAKKLASGNFEGAMMDLMGAADEGEKVVAGLAETWMEIGALAYLNDTFTAMDAYERATQLAPENFEALNMLGSLYIRTGRHEEAIKIYEKMQNVAEGDEQNAAALGNLGFAYFSLDMLDDAERYFRDALELNEQAGNVIGAGEDLRDLGEVLRLKGDDEKAGEYMRRALKIAQDANNKGAEASAHLRLGGLAFGRGRLSEAGAAYTKARLLWEELGDPEGRAVAMNSLATVELERGKLDAARAMVDEALKIAQDVSARESEAYAQGLLGEIAEKRGDRIAAINHYRDAEFIYRQNGQYTLAAPYTEKMTALGATPSPEGPEN